MSGERIPSALGYDSAHAGESTFLRLAPGQSGQFVAIFTNTGSNAWVKGSASQVDLAICAPDKVTCGMIPSTNAGWAVGWSSATAYATTTPDVVAPGQSAFFVYNVKAPASAGVGTTVRFNGDLALHATGERIHPEGYYQDATVFAPADPDCDANAVAVA